MKSIFHFTLNINYYIASLMLLIAGILKINSDDVSEIMQILFDRGIISIQWLMTILKVLPYIEISIAFVALSKWRSKDMSIIVSSLYICFSIVILYVSDGYLLQPIDCGCFGEHNHDWPVYILLLRNMTVAILLICYRFERNN